ncbi:TIGR00255 family protein [Anaerovirgula multivorans]|uniref:TIGR00255 family protein n=1 Tax=Anaerovirgula multivorans TaxID=312168 RepID=A0A239A7V2_9FIRM|nr:YicC/YloC family endoribonuclease [Anaerovirgula multivorans]SNR90963.1 TIGR00255 family protein [Anaerovirgula multivorans]
MLISMTGFGRSEVQKEYKQFNIELKTVNHRYMDISIKMPRSFAFLEDNIRQVVKNYIKRGRIEIYINYKNIGESDVKVSTDMALAHQYISALEEIHNSFKIEKDIAVSTIARFPDVLQLEKAEEDEEIIWNLLNEGLIDALNNLSGMRQVEGLKLKEDLLHRLETLVLLIKKIEVRSPEIVLEHKERLNKRIKELLDGESDVDESRIALEVALFADRSNITEEIVRLNSHISQFKKSMKQEEAVGRKLDFIIQEMNREINTIGSKANDLTISNIVVDVKSELEKIREQIQNIE